MNCVYTHGTVGAQEDKKTYQLQQQYSVSLSAQRQHSAFKPGLFGAGHIPVTHSLMNTRSYGV